MNSIIETLLNSDEPSVRFKVLVNVLGRELESVEIKNLQEEIKSSPRVRLLLSTSPLRAVVNSERDQDGKIPFHPYTK